MNNSNFQSPNILPQDQANQKLLAFVHPPDWQNPTPKNNYDLVVIGAGTAGLVTAAGVAGLDIGLKIALIEKHLMGGDCLNFGCVPSKCLIRTSRTISEINQAQTMGVHLAGKMEIDFAAVMERMRKIRAEMSQHDSVQRFQDLGIDIFLGEAQFIGKGSIRLGDINLSYKKAVIATGARAVKPAITGLEEAGYLTNESVFSLTKLPQRLAVIGGGPIGCELAQAFQYFGSQVTLFHHHNQLLNQSEPEAAATLQNCFVQQGIQLLLDSQIQSVEKTQTEKIIHYLYQNQHLQITVDEILVGVGRSPNVEGLNLEAVDVKYDQRTGIKVNDYLQTSNPDIYAAGDICSAQKFTHAADAAARIVIKNMLFSPLGFGRSKVSQLIIPSVIYTTPEIAQVGLSEKEARAKAISLKSLHIPLANIDRAVIDGETDGFIKILYRANSDQILGATIVANQAGEMISELTSAIANKIGLSQLSKVIHPYPTQGEVIKKAADAYRKTLLTPRAKSLLKLISKFS